MRRERNKYLLSFCLLALYVAFQACVSVFPHEHILNGEKLVHSHPYSNANHSHTADQAVTIARLSTIQTLEAQGYESQEIELPVLYAVEYEEDSFSIRLLHTDGIGLRAPPFCWSHT